MIERHGSGVTAGRYNWICAEAMQYFNEFHSSIYFYIIHRSGSNYETTVMCYI